MGTTARTGRVLLTALTGLVCAGALAPAAVAGPAVDPEVPPLALPDLDQRPPTGIATEMLRNGRARLIFDSAVDSRGPGLLEIDGRRQSGETEMRADQVLRLPDGQVVRYRGVGVMNYVISPDHRHWHLVDFMRFELRSLDGDETLRRDRKTGFCVGDRYAVPNLPVRPANWEISCGRGKPGLLRMTMGITPGYGDNYSRRVDGQHIDVTGLPAGRYVLVHQADPNGLIQETTRGNNFASALLRLTWRGREARVSVLRVCPATAECAPLPRSEAAKPVPAPVLTQLPETVSWADELSQATGGVCEAPAGLPASKE